MQVATRSIASLIAKLEQCGPLSPVESAALADAAAGAEAYNPNDFITDEGRASNGLHVLVEGVSQRHKTLPDGTRQIISLDLPGDILDLPAVLRGRHGYSTTALTRAVVVAIPETALWQVVARHPGVGRVLWTDMARDMAIAQEWLLNLGRRSAQARVAHFLCETYWRLTAQSSAKGLRCAFPLTQAELADAMGLSSVHINRVLQQLRRDDLISLHSGELVIKDWDELAEVASFTTDYLTPCARKAAAFA